MAYIGVQPTDTYLSIASQQITGNGGATYTLDYSVSNEEDVAVFVNNVRQNVSSYTVSGTSLTLGGTISASDSCWVLFLGRTVGTKTPAVGSVTNDMLAGSINESKLLGSIPNSKLANSSITLNGSAVSLGGSATTPQGLEVAEQWKLYNQTSFISTSSADFTSPSFSSGLTGSAQMTQSSGIFTFPSTGYYLINMVFNTFDNDAEKHRQVSSHIRTTTNNGSNWTLYAFGNHAQDYLQSNNTHASNYIQCVFDVTDTSTHKVKFGYFFTNTGLYFYGDGHGISCYFQKLGDT